MIAKTGNRLGKIEAVAFINRDIDLSFYASVIIILKAQI